MKWFLKNFLLFAILAVNIPFLTNAETVNIDASKLLPKSEVFLSPRSGSFVEGSTFDVPILLNSKGNSINGIEVRINFDKDRLNIIKPSSGKSIIGVWVEPPKYDNTKGTASYVGVVPDGIVTEAGLIGTITFKAIRTGSASISISANSDILLNNGLGTKVSLDLGRAVYDIIQKAPDGVRVYSDTHPFQDRWYNNNSPVILWDKDTGVSGFSFELDDKPSTVPDNSVDTEDTSKFFENLGSGQWYFHIKANKGGVWGTTGHFSVKIDTLPPAEFQPEVNYILAAGALVEKALISFFTTDNMSGIDHYEVGVIDKKESPNLSPAFVEAESPFQVSLNNTGDLRVIVRAIDKAGNVRDGFIDVSRQSILARFINDYLTQILISIILVGILSFLLHYLFGHHIIRNIQKFRQMVKKEDDQNENNKTPPEFFGPNV